MAELQALVRAGGGGGGGGGLKPFTCSPPSASATTADFRLSFNLLSAGNQCRVSQSTPAGFVPAYFASNLHLGTGAPAGTIFIGTYGVESSGMQLVEVPAAFRAFVHPDMGAGYVAPPGTYQLTIRETASGKRWRVNFTLAGIGKNDFFYFKTITHTVSQVTPLS